MAKLPPERVTHRPKGRFLRRTSAYRYADAAPRARGGLLLFIELPRAFILGDRTSSIESSRKPRGVKEDRDSPTQPSYILF